MSEWYNINKQNVYLIKFHFHSSWWLYFGFLQSVVIKYTDISDKHTAPIFRVISPCDSVDNVK